MKVAAQQRYGGPDVIEIVERPKPMPGPGEVLVEVRASTVTLADCAFRKAEPFIVRLFGGLFRPKLDVLGDDIAGVVVAIGAGVSRFAVGDRVHGCTGAALGGMAEYVCVKETAALVKVPEGVDLIPLGGMSYSYLTAMPFIRDEGRVKPGDHVLINGAASSVGAIALQLAKHFGAEVTAVASGRHRALLERLGADHVIDRQVADFTAARGAYDVVFDAVGKSSFAQAAPTLKPGGIYLTTVPSWGIFGLMLSGGQRGGKRGKLATTGLRSDGDKLKDLHVLNRLLEQGAIRAVTDRVFPLHKIVEAHRYVEREVKAGDVVVTMPVAQGPLLLAATAASVGA
ncbi:NADPH:quinone reductase-like Zn-dependent oxidoreductase [Devosia subaequoris]|uniref:NADPH:quinone reductase-like Zn-dependent oxidoreductase n=1 Tax=Devosia subaequoris TaxID=395930 RepID=A0A7W6NBG4_9HYPH|nr:NAD(P)-dependent alcohol dehydrogenase [Devosia subaequoris]MBB4051626.1 NADPH:quinone reductase-like Zn-dependent oxidoreductase [Devosia subaequoris]MCP1209216.1 NAD(P)-dependent alcohol dehydrogenase [Devosia subaequoris]